MSTYEENLAIQLDNCPEMVLFPDKDSTKFRTVGEYSKYIYGEYMNWVKVNCSNVSAISSGFSELYSVLQQRLNDVYQTEEYIKNVVENQIVNIAGQNLIHSGTIAGKRIMELFQNDENLEKLKARGYFGVVSKRGLEPSLFSRTDYVEGVLEAFISYHPEMLTKKADAAARKFEKVIIDLTHKKEEIVETFDSTMAAALENKRKHDTSVTNFMEESQNQIEELENKLKEMSSQFETEKNGFFQKAEEERQKHENTYKTLLMLKEPKKLWEEVKLGKMIQGSIWTALAVALTVFLGCVLRAVLYNLPDSLKKFDKTFSYENIRGLIVLAVGVSLGVYLLRLFVKLALSAFHLAADAKERASLVYFYLTLMNERDISSEERVIVMQSLFSRSDTGLLKGDSSPSFPEGITSTILKNFKG